MSLLPRFANWPRRTSKPHRNGKSPHPRLPVSVSRDGSPRILILSAGVGAGHIRAAEAVELALRRLAPEAHVRNLDVLTLATAPFRHCYGQIYLDMINRAPKVLGYFYDLMDRPKPPLADGWEQLRVSLERMSMRPFLHLLQAEPWDLVINTHFLSEEIVASLRREGRFRAPQVLVTTDFETHRLWVHQPCEHYFTATEEAAAYLACYGVPRSDTTATGIPVHPVFAEAKDRAGCLERQGLVGDRPILLQLAGGFGVGPIEELYRAVLDVPLPLEVVVVAGRNVRAREHLKTMPVPPRHRVKVLGFTHEIDELMAVADLVVTKPGGLTTSECLARGTPLAVVSPVPGQEERNSDYILENGAAIKINHVPTLALKVTEVLRDRERLAQLKANARRLGRPRAAFAVVQRSLALLRGYRGGTRRTGRPARRSEHHVGAARVRGDGGADGRPLAAARPAMV